MKASLVMGFIALVLAGAILEGGLRFYAELHAARFVGLATPTDDTQPDPLLVAWFKPNYVSPDGGPAYDANGFRLNGAPRPAAPSEVDAMVGGSTAYGWDAPDDQTITAFLEQGLRAANHPDAEVLNAGYPGMTSIDTLLVYQGKLEPLRPKTVVLLAGLNDIYYAVDWIPENRLHWASRTYEVGLRARHEPALRPLVDAISRYALGNCYTCYALGASLSGLYDRTGMLPMLRTAAFFGQEPLAGDNTRAMQLTGWVVGELARRVHAEGGCLIVAWQPIAGVPNGAPTASESAAEQQISLRAPTWPNMAPRMFKELRDAARPAFASGQAIEVDTTTAFDNAAEPVYQNDGVHYTALGNKLVAQAIEPALQAGCTG
ncbi:MAG: SGNH/GDSL hydrolase family protein [Chloroflexi bacterium]|nr:SGNH/GDSL hydrolase family protein [Chloroflexota bacterium]